VSPARWREVRSKVVEKLQTLIKVKRRRADDAMPTSKLIKLQSYLILWNRRRSPEAAGGASAATAGAGPLAPSNSRSIIATCGSV